MKVRYSEITRELIQNKLTLFLEKLPLYLAPFFPFAFLAGNAVTEIAVAFTVICFFAHLYLTQKAPFIREKWVWCAALFILYLTVSSLFVPYPGKALRVIAHMTEFIVLALALGYWVLASKGALHRLFVALSIVLLFTAADTLYQYLNGGYDIFGWTANMAERLTGPFEYKRVGAFMSFLMFPVLTVFLNRLWTRFPVIWAHLLGMVLLGAVFMLLLLTGERVTLIYFALGYVIMLFLWQRQHIAMLRMTLIAMSFVFVSGGGFFAVKLLAPEKLEPLYQTSIYKTLSERIFKNSLQLAQLGKEAHYAQIWSRAYKMFREKPLTGVGVQHFKKLCPDPKYGPTDNLSGRCGHHVHHFYLELLAETGLIGCVLICLVFLLLLLKIWQTRQSWSEHPVLLGLFTAYFIAIWPLAPFRGFFQSWRAMMFWFIVGWMIAGIKIYGSKKNEKLHLHE